jgi:hypothetical protein
VHGQDPNDVAFVRTTATIGGCVAVKEYVACKMYLLGTGFGFESVPLGMTPMSKVETPLPIFAVGNIATEYTAHVLAEVETEVEKVLGSFGAKEYDVLYTVNILNDDCLNQLLEQMGVLYTPRPLPGSVAHRWLLRNEKQRYRS